MLKPGLHRLAFRLTMKDQVGGWVPLEAQSDLKNKTQAKIGFNQFNQKEDSILGKSSSFIIS